MRSGGRVVWLWWWLGVLVAGCGQAVLPGPTPPSTPLLTLALSSTATPTPILRLLRTPTVKFTSITPVTRAIATPFPVPISPPTCYETPVGSLWCLGLVRNGLTITLERVVVRVYLLNGEGTALVGTDTAIAHRLLAPGETSPYGVLFDAVPDGNAGPVTVLISALEYNGPRATLDVRNMHSESRESGYHVTGTLTNPTTMPLEHMALIVTLFDANQRVTGFRQMRWPANQQLAPSAMLAFDVDAVPQGQGTVRAEVSGEAQPG